MSTLYSIASNTLSFLATPLISLKDGMMAQIEYNQLLDGKQTDNLFDSDNHITLEEIGKLEGQMAVAADKVSEFVRELGLGGRDISILHSGVNDKGSSAAGSLQHGAKIAIFLGTKLMEDIATEFTDEHKFIIAHEVAHIQHDDPIMGLVNMRLNRDCLKMVAYGAGMAILSSLDCSLIVSHIASCAISSFSGRFSEQRSRYKIELRADQCAAERSVELLEGGKKYFAKCITKGDAAAGRRKKCRRDFNCKRTHPPDRTRLKALQSLR